jgi:hypothetical protein
VQHTLDQMGVRLGQPIITAIQPYRHGDGGPRRHGYPSRTPT